MRLRTIIILAISVLGVSAAGFVSAADTKQMPASPTKPGTVTGQPVKPGAADDKSSLTLWPPFGPDLAVSLPNPMNGSVTVRNNGIVASKIATLRLYCKRVGWTGSRVSDPNSGCARVPGFTWCSYTDNFPGCSTISIPPQLPPRGAPPLLPGQVYVHTVPSWSTLRWDSGSYEFGAEVTVWGGQKDTNTGNNTARSTLTVVPRNEPDLVPVLNNPMDGTLIVRNDGLAAAPPTRLRLWCLRQVEFQNPNGQVSLTNQACTDVQIPPRYASEYSWEQPAGYLVMNVPALAPGATWRLPQAFWRALRWTRGSYQFQATADSDRVVLESNEGNNRSNVSTMVVP